MKFNFTRSIFSLFLSGEMALRGFTGRVAANGKDFQNDKAKDISRRT